MKKKTNLENVKTIAIAFLYQPLKETKFSPLVVMHPIFEYGITGIPQNGNVRTLNILENEEDLQFLIKIYEDRIMNSELAEDVYNVIRKSYRLTFLKYVANDLSSDDMSRLLAHAWTTSENPNGDINVPLNTIVRWFKKANKKVLMDDTEYSVYSSLPDIFKIYRGVAVNRNPDGLSWTRSKKTAEWFANRYNTAAKCGYVQAATVKKEDVLAYFNSRNEDEIVISVEKKDVDIIR